MGNWWRYDELKKAEKSREGRTGKRRGEYRRKRE
jgi:hypothetical protein